jgi:L-methionine (R)-S-oxide reductase
MSENPIDPAIDERSAAAAGAALAALLAGERDWIANCANFAAFVFQALPRLNWAGFYFLRGQQLVLGPFQGKPACVRIDVGRGVCGTAVARRAAVLVPDVHAFPGHIACDSASRSELVLPVWHGNELLGVFDLDSPDLQRFSTREQHWLEGWLRLLMAHTEAPTTATRPG